MAVPRATLNQWLVMIFVLGVAIALRVVDFPPFHGVRDMDETGYCLGSAQLIEGITPGYKAAPGGPLLWAGWAWLAAEAGHEVIAPPKPAAALELRPFIALDHVLFDTCRDLGSLHRTLVGLNVALAMFGTAVAVGLGRRFGGVIGAILLGGLFAVVPIFLDFSEMSRPYSMAWSFGVISLFFASTNGPRGRRWLWTAIFLGLSISSRIEMLCLIPLVWWVFIARSSDGSWKRVIIQLTLLSLCVAQFVSPWLMTHLIGNLRTIATVRFAGTNALPWNSALFELTIGQGMGLVIVAALVALFLQPSGLRLRAWVLMIFAMTMTVLMLIGSADGIHQHGVVFLDWFLLIASMIGPVVARWPKLCAVGVVLMLVFPLVQSLRLMRFQKSLADGEDSVAWVERHVPAGTTVYLIDGGDRTLLPTPAASAALWDEVNDDQAWRKKLKLGLDKFHLSAGELPRALSEENLIQERGNRRKWFILGGQTDRTIPRYDIRLVKGSPVFGISNQSDLESAMNARGGILIWRSGYHIDPPALLGDPVMQWISQQGNGVKIFCTADVRKIIH